VSIAQRTIVLSSNLLLMPIRTPGRPSREGPSRLPHGAGPEDVGMMDWSGSDDLKGIMGGNGNRFTASSTVIVARQIAVVTVFQFQVQMLAR
jgi:hypothetical protein